MAKASIIITTHNRPHCLPRAVASAQEAGEDVEIVVVDDGSVDETAELCSNLGDINYVRLERNQRVAGARNVGLLASTGEYITFLDDDDARLPGSLNAQVEILARTPEAMMIYGQALTEDPDGEEHEPYPSPCPTGDLFWQLVTRNFIPCGSVVFRRAGLSTLGLLDDSIPGVDDWDLWVRISEIYPIIGTQLPVTIWRRSTPVSKQGSSGAARLVAQSVHQFREVWMNLPRARNASRKTRQVAWKQFSQNMAEHLIWQSVRSFRHRDLQQPLTNLAIIPRLHPLTLMRIAHHRIN